MTTISNSLYSLLCGVLLGFGIWGDQLAALAADADMKRLDYHQVRGRKPVGTESGRREGELDFTLSGASRVQGMASYGPQWSNGAHLLWDGEVGQSMESTFEVDEGGTYDISIQLTLAGDYGTFRMTLPQSSISRDIDLYSPRVELAPLIVLQDISLKPGPQAIGFKLTGANTQARKFQNRGYLMGLDFIQLSRKDLSSPQDSSQQATGTRPTGNALDSSITPPHGSANGEANNPEHGRGRHVNHPILCPLP